MKAFLVHIVALLGIPIVIYGDVLSMEDLTISHDAMLQFRPRGEKERSNLSISMQSPVFHPNLNARKNGWQPYSDNGGTAVAVAGPDFVIIAADTRLCDGYNILSRTVSRVNCIGDALETTFLATAGCWSDTIGLLKLIRNLVEEYKYMQERSITTESLARLLSNHLYYRRSFPFYTHNIIAGLDSKGVGAVYGYDSIGSFERQRVAVAGSGRSLMQPILDRFKHNKSLDGSVIELTVDISCESAFELLKSAFIAAAERDIGLGDEADIVIITKEGVRREKIPLGKH